jgi:hypothetical protein
MIKSSLVGIKDSSVREYFLNSLKENDFVLFANIKTALVQKLQGIDKNITDTSLDDEDMITALADPTGKIMVGNQEVSLDGTFQFGFFADCVNETIVVSDVKIAYEKEVLDQ